MTKKNRKAPESNFFNSKVFKDNANLFCISKVSNDMDGNDEYWKETERLFALPEAGAVIYNYLKSIDLTGFDPKDIPECGQLKYHQLKHHK